MISAFTLSFIPMFKAIIQIFIVMGIGGFLLRKKILPDSIFDALSKVLVFVFLPCLSFSKIVKGLDTQAYPLWWVLPVSSIVITFFSLAVSYLFFFKNRNDKRDLMALSSFQNCTFFVLPIGKIVFPEQFDQFALFVFLFALAANPLLWSVAKVLISDKADLSIKKLLTPPVIASLSALTIVLFGVQKYIPDVILEPLDLLGSATVPVATFILGATLSHASISDLPKFLDTAKYLLIKFCLIPIATILCLVYFNIKDTMPLLCQFLIIQSAAAPAAALTIQVRHYGGDVKRTGSAMLVGYILCLFVLPLWLAIWAII